MQAAAEQVKVVGLVAVQSVAVPVVQGSVPATQVPLPLQASPAVQGF